MNMEKRDFDKSAKSWDQKTGRVKLACDAANATIEEGNK